MIAAPPLLFFALTKAARERPRIFQHVWPVSAVAFTPDSRKLIVAATELVEWDLSTDSLQPRILPRGKSGPSNGLAVSSLYAVNGLVVSTVTSPPDVCSWDFPASQIKNLKQYNSGVPTADYVMGLVSLKDGRIVTCYANGDGLKLINSQTQQVIGWLSSNDLPFRNGSLLKVDDSIKSVDVSADGKFAATGISTAMVRVWDLQRKRLIRSIVCTPHEGFVIHNAAVDGVKFSSDGKLLAAGGENRTVRVWNVKTGRLLHTFYGGGFDGHLHKVLLAFSPDGDSLATLDVTENIKVWDLKTGAIRREMKGQPGPITDLEFSPDGEWLAVASTDRTVKLWNMRGRS
jgi:WD40 repeat protein